ncbi:MAG: RT0821/Lpp0805 family surface protein, partial [Rhodospirillales bacterium]|nr:RT0821/Lpp0805 family surface protein [Rhodospirillales bacterium]
RTADRALSGATDGETLRWTNTETGNLGTITPTSTFTSDAGNRCRKFDVMISTPEGAQLGGGAACQTADGDWAAARGTLG